MSTTPPPRTHVHTHVHTHSTQFAASISPWVRRPRKRPCRCPPSPTSHLIPYLCSCVSPCTQVSTLPWLSGQALFPGRPQARAAMCQGGRLVCNQHPVIPSPHPAALLFPVSAAPLVRLLLPRMCQSCLCEQVMTKAVNSVQQTAAKDGSTRRTKDPWS